MDMLEKINYVEKIYKELVMKTVTVEGGLQNTPDDLKAMMEKSLRDLEYVKTMYTDLLGMVEETYEFSKMVERTLRFFS